MKKTLIVSLILAFAAVCVARDITVDDDGPADFNNIRDAVDDANAGDVIIVADGIYTGPDNRAITIDKSLTIESKNGPTNCIIDCNASVSEPSGVFIFVNINNYIGLLKGFTITGAYYPEAGAVVVGGRYDLEIRNCIIYGNVGDGVKYMYACWGDASEIVNSTIHNNSGYGINLFYGGSTDTVSIRDSIVRDEIYANDVGTKCSWPTIYADTSILLNSWADGTGSIVADPCFADSDNGDYHLQSAAGRWEPLSETWVTDANTSLGIDFGDPASDWTEELWPHGKRINVGAYGGTPEASMSQSSVGNIANLDNDANDVVWLDDLAFLVETWLREEILLAEDLGRDGKVDFSDFAIFAENWLSGM